MRGECHRLASLCVLAPKRQHAWLAARQGVKLASESAHQVVRHDCSTPRTSLPLRSFSASRAQGSSRGRVARPAVKWPGRSRALRRLSDVLQDEGGGPKGAVVGRRARPGTHGRGGPGKARHCCKPIDRWRSMCAAPPATHIRATRRSSCRACRLLPGVAGQAGRRRHRGGLAVGRCCAGRTGPSGRS